MHSELGLIHHTSHPHIVGNKAYNIGQKLGLWLGPHYVIAEMECPENKPGTDSTTTTTTTGKPPGDGILEARNRKDDDRASSATTGVFGKKCSSKFSTASCSSPSDNNNKANIPGSSTHNKSEDQISGGGLGRTGNKTGSSGKGSSSDGWSPWSSAKILATVPSRWPLSICYMHSFCITQNYFVIIEQPLSIFLPTVPINHLCGEKPIASCLRYYPEEDTLFHVISRYPGKSSGKGRRVFRAPSFFFLHTINAYEMRDVDTADTFVIVDICCYDDPAMIDCMYVDALKV